MVDDPAADGASSGSRSGATSGLVAPGRTLVDVALVAALALSISVVSLVIVMRSGLLAPSTYQSALVEVDAYERTYTEVLADTELAGITDPLIGRLVHSVVEPAEIRALTTNMLRWTVPPDALERRVEQVIDLVLGYIRGDVDELTVTIDVDEILDRIPSVTITGARSAIAQLASEVVASERFDDAVASFAADLEAGRVPDVVPVLGGQEYDPDRVADAVFAQFGLEIDPALRLRILAAAQVDERSALTEAASEWVSAHAERVEAQVIEQRPDGERRIELRAAAANRAATATADAVAVLARARDTAAVLRPLTAVVAAVLALVVAGLIAWRHVCNRRRAVSLVALGMVAGGALSIVGWFVIERVIGAPVTAAVGDGTSAVPSELGRLLLDLEAVVGDDLTRVARRVGGYPLVLGLVVLAISEGATRLPGIRARHLVVTAAGIFVTVAVGGVVVLITTEPDTPQTCNGHVELCDRAFDNVVYAATHNSMSSPEVVPIWPEHDGDIRAQLDAGVRALLIDTHYWTSIDSVQNLATAADPHLSSATASRLFEVLGDRTEGRPGTYLCHNHCVFGAMTFGEALDMIADFLETNSREVVTLVIQDAITPADTEADILAAGLGSYLYTHEPGSQWPTLGQMIDADERLVILAEEAGPPPAWYHQGFELMQETPFFFRSADQMSCEPNRGDPESTLFQMNHWIQRIAPDRVDSTVINEHDFIVERALRCRDERGLMPNFVAVNFYNIGDLFDAVDSLNGLGERAVEPADERGSEGS